MNRLLEAAQRHGDGDPELQELISDLQQEWAKLPAPRPGLSNELLFAYLRQAYAAGYLRGLEEPA